MIGTALESITNTEQQISDFTVGRLPPSQEIFGDGWQVHFFGCSGYASTISIPNQKSLDDLFCFSLSTLDQSSVFEPDALIRSDSKQIWVMIPK